MRASVFSSTRLVSERFSLFLKCSNFLQRFKPQRYCKMCSYKNRSLVDFTSACPSFATDEFH